MAVALVTKVAGGYPCYFRNREKLVLRAAGNPKWIHFPLIPKQTDAWTQGRPGPIRSIYREGDRTVYDVAIEGPPTPMSGSKKKKFNLGVYFRRRESPR